MSLTQATHLAFTRFYS